MKENKQLPIRRVVDSLEYLSTAEKAYVADTWPEVLNPEKYDVRKVLFRTADHMDEVIKIPRFRDFNPDLVFWIDATNVSMMWNRQSLIPLEINLPHDGEMFWIQGKFFLDSSGNRTFKPKIHRDANVYLIKVEWGGPNSSTRGLEWDVLEPLAWHKKRCVSNNGKQGINYYVFSTRFIYRDEPFDDTAHREEK